MSENEIRKNGRLPRGKEELEINWMGILQRIIAAKKKLYKAAGVGAVLGIVLAVSMPKTYTVDVALSPEMGNEKGGGGLASMAVSLLGGSLDGLDGADALNAQLAPEIVASTPFLLEVLQTRVKNPEDGRDTTFAAYLEEERSSWLKALVKAPGKAMDWVKGVWQKAEEKAGGADSVQVITLNKKESEKLEKLREVITAETDKKTGLITVSITLQEPNITAFMAQETVKKLQEYIIQYRTGKATEDYKNLEVLCKERQQEYYAAQERYAHYLDMNNNLILQSTMAEQERLKNDMTLAYQVYTQLTQQLQVARAKIQEVKPVFAIVEPAVVPLYPSGAGKKVIVIGVVLLSVILTGVWEVVGKKLWKEFCYHLHKEAEKEIHQN